MLHLCSGFSWAASARVFCFWAMSAWLLRPHSGFVRIDQHCSSLPSFALWLAFPTSDYYEGSAPCPPWSQADLPRSGERDKVPKFTYVASAWCLRVLPVRLARLFALLVVGTCGVYGVPLVCPNETILPKRGRNPTTTSHSLRDDVLAFGASDGSFLRNPVTTLASSTGGCRAPPCHIVGRVLRTHSASGPVPVSLATCTLLTGYLIEYILLMRFLAHHWDGHGRGDGPSPPSPERHSPGSGRNAWRYPPGGGAPA